MGEGVTICIHCNWPGAPKPGVMCSACVARFQVETAPPPLSEEEARMFTEFFAQPAECLDVIVDDIDADGRMQPRDRKKVLDHYDASTATIPCDVTLVQIHVCGPSTSPCGPNRDDHIWDDEVEFTDGAGRVTGGSVACSRCGMTAMDYDIWSAE